MKKEVIHTPNAAVTGAPLVQATRLGQLVFCSGCSPRDPRRGNAVVEGGFREQATQAMENLNAARVRLKKVLDEWSPTLDGAEQDRSPDIEETDMTGMYAVPEKSARKRNAARTPRPVEQVITR